MAHLERTVHIDAPVERVFAYATDVSKLPEHDPTIIECHALTPGPIHKSTRLRMRMRDGDREREVEAEVTEMVPNQAFAFHTVGSGAYLRRRYTFAPHDGGTRVQLEEELALPGLIGRLKEAFWAQRELARQAEADQLGLKRALEAT